MGRYTRPPKGLELRVAGQSLPLTLGREFTSRDLLGSGKADRAAIVEPHPQNPGAIGLRNLTPQAWSVTIPGGNVRTVPSGKAVRLVPGARLNFGNGRVAQVAKSKRPARGPLQTAVARAFLPLLALGGLLAIAWILRKEMSGGVATWVLLALTGGVVWIARKQFADVLRAIDRFPWLRPWWSFISLVPLPLRVIVATFLSVLLAWWLTPHLSSMFEGFGFLVAVSSLAICTLFVHFLVWDPPASTNS